MTSTHHRFHFTRTRHLHIHALVCLFIASHTLMKTHASSATASTNAPVEITLHADKREDTVSENDIVRLKAIAGGVSWEGVSPDILDPLADIGLQYARMSSRLGDRPWKNAPSSAWIDANGKLNFSYDYAAMIAAPARRIGAGLHLLLTENVPAVLRADNLSPKAHEAVPKHEEYADFVSGALHALALESPDKQSPETIYVEVGNEPDTPGYWYQNRPYEEKFDRYMKAYRTVLEGVRRYEAEHPKEKGGARIRVGGPAATAFSFMINVSGQKSAPPFNWVHRFIKTCSDENLRMDFVSFHAYANWNPVSAHIGHRTFPNLANSLETIRLWRDMWRPEAEFLVTEWGLDSTRAGAGARQNFTHVAAAQSMAMLDIMLRSQVNRGVFLLAHLPPLTDDCYWPTLFTQRGEPTPVWHLLGWINQLHGHRLRVARNHGDSTSTTPGILASHDPNTGSGSAILWNTKWYLNPNDRMAPGWTEAEDIDIQISLKGLGDASTEFSSAIINADTCPAPEVKAISKEEQSLINRGERLVPRPRILTANPLPKENIVGNTLTLRLPKESVTLLKWTTAPTAQKPASNGIPSSRTDKFDRM